MIFGALKPLFTCFSSLEKCALPWKLSPCCNLFKLGCFVPWFRDMGKFGMILTWKLHILPLMLLWLYGKNCSLQVCRCLRSHDNSVWLQSPRLIPICIRSMPNSKKKTPRWNTRQKKVAAAPSWHIANRVLSIHCTSEPSLYIMITHHRGYANPGGESSIASSIAYTHTYLLWPVFVSLQPYRRRDREWRRREVRGRWSPPRVLTVRCQWRGYWRLSWL